MLFSGTASTSAAPAVSPAAPLQRARSLGTPRPAPSAAAIAPRRPESEQSRATTTRRGDTLKAMAATDDDAGGSAEAPSPSAPPSAAPPNVAELVMLMKIDPDEDANAVLDELWSAQYLAPGTLCAFAGETAAAASEGGGGGEASGGTAAAAAAALPPPSSSAAPLAPATDFTHALHMRFPTAAAATAFMAHGAFSAAAERARQASSGGKEEGGSRPRPPLVAVFEGRVEPPSLETLFRRGPEWESGIEHALLLSSHGCSGEEGEEGDEEERDAAADLFVSQLRELAESSLVGAVQSTSGRVVSQASSSPQSPSPQNCATHAILTRFAGPEQLQAFLDLPPVKALLSPPAPSPQSAEGGSEGGGAGGAPPNPAPPAAPVRAFASAQYSIAPAQGVTGRQGA